MDWDFVVKEVVEVFEWVLSYCFDDYDFSILFKVVVVDYDFFLCVVMWIIYEFEVKGGMIVKQKVKIWYIYWKDFLYEVV